MILACFLGISFCSPISAARYFETDTGLESHREISAVLATISTSTNSTQGRISRSDRTFDADHSQPQGLSGTSDRFTGYLASLYISSNAETDPVSGLYFSSLHERAPPTP
jgi:hypothetical protein